MRQRIIIKFLAKELVNPEKKSIYQKVNREHYLPDIKQAHCKQENRFKVCMFVKYLHN